MPPQPKRTSTSSDSPAVLAQVLRRALGRTPGGLLGVVGVGGGGGGTPGADGATWHSGSGAPGSGLGSDGDFYFRDDTGQIYKKASGSWSAIIDLLTATEAAAGYQPLDADLTNLAALSTTSFGRSLLELANVAALLTLLGLGDAMIFKGVVDCSANPNYPAADRGDTYKVSVAGKIGGGSGPNVELGDTLICTTDSTASGTHAAVGANWEIVQANIDGAVVGPSSATDNDLVVFDGATGRLVKDNSKKSANVPSDDEKSALAGTDGTPGSTNRYVTDSDDRLNLSQLTLSEAILTLDPALFWTLGSGGAGLTDQSGNGRDGAANGGITIGGASSLNSESAGATDFDGSNDYVSSSYDPFVAGAVRTFIGYIYRDAHATVDTVFGGDGSGHLPAFQLSTGQVASFWFDQVGSSATLNTLASQLPDATVLAFALIADDAADTVELYLNGVSLGVKSLSGTYHADGGNFKLGALGSATDPFDGKMSHVAVFEKRLTPATIQWLYRIGAGHPKDWGLVYSLPTGAIYGDTCQYVADSTNGIVWNLVYDGQGSYPWKVLGGGPPLVAQVDTDETRANAAYGALATAGPSVTVPLAGDYDVEIGSQWYSANTAGGGLHSFDVGGTAASNNDACQGNQGGASNALQTDRVRRRKTGITAGAALVSKYLSSGVTDTGHWLRRTMAVYPVRVG